MDVLMIKIVILACFVLWMFIRQLTKSKPNSIWRIKLKRLSRYALIGAIIWLITISFGSVKYQIYTDKVFTYQGNIQTIFAWQENRLLPIESLATPVLLSLDYETTYPLTEKSAQSLTQSYPYEPYYLGVSQFLGTVLSFFFLLLYLSRHISTDRRWQEALASDSKAGYRDFLHWANSKKLRRLHCLGMEKKVDIAMQSIDQRARLKLEMYRQGYTAQGLNSAFLEMLNEVVKSGYNSITVKAAHHDNFKPLAEVRDITAAALNFGAREPKLFMERYYQHYLSNALNKETPAKFDTMVINAPEHLRFSYPEPSSANSLLEKQLASVLNQGKKRFTGDDLVEFTPSSSSLFNQPGVCLEVSYLCQLGTKKGSRQTSIWAGENPNKLITMNGTEYPGGNILWLVFGMAFNWRLLIDGKEISSGHCSTLPDSEICNLSRPQKQHMPAKSEVEKQIFEVVALSNVSVFFAQLMGVEADSINQHTINLRDKKTAENVKTQNQASNELTEKLEDALRGEALEELMKSSGVELYQQNKAAVDTIISDYIKNNGDTDTVLMIIDLLGDSAPELVGWLTSLIGDSSDE